MTLNARTVCLIIAVICFVIAARGVRSDFNLIAIGLAFFAGSFLP